MANKSARTVHVNLPPALLGPAEAIAEWAGLSLPELLRACLRVEIARREAAGHLAGQDTPADVLFRRAAFGDLLAQRELCHRGYEAALNEAAAGDHLKAIEAVAAAITWARTAVEHGEAFDQTRLAGLLLMRGDIAKAAGDTDFAELCDAWALARLDVAAEGGSEIAEEGLLGAADDMTPGAVEMARHCRAEIEAGR